MGRPPLHTVAAFLDAAVELFARGGDQAVTMTAVAKEVGAPSGSIYHRFPDRGSLLAQMWLRTTCDFEAGYRNALGDEPTPESAIEAAVWSVDWCRAHPAPAAVLQSGLRSLQPETWPADAREELDERNAARDTELRAAARAVTAKADRPADEVAFAMIELPLAVVRPHLHAGQPVPESASDRVRRIATRLLRG